ncbi:MAG: hypothetical protein HGA63_10920 [Syntrophobacteraceae bacterium]|nr:hypothetical protein [Syntrophobacteraceae bacterium]
MHAVLAALGGDLGMSVDLAKVPRDEPLRNDQVLFSESCGRFLVTVPPGNQGEFEALFQGMPLGLVGKVQATPELEVTGLDGETLLREPVALLRQSWKDAAQIIGSDS